MNKNYQSILEYWTRKRIPYIFDETLSLYELVRKTIKALNEMIKDQNELKDAIIEFIDIFENDIQETLIQVLETWELSGRLEDVINEALFNGKADKSIELKVNDKWKSVKEYGAKGDGITDDTLAIQAALDDEEEKTIFFPKGVYLVGNPSTTLKSGHLILNQSRKRLVGKNMWDSVITTNTSCESLFKVGNAEHLHIENMAFDGNDLVTNTFNTSDYSPFMYLKHVRFDKAIDTACKIQTFLTEVTGCMFRLSDTGLHVHGVSGGITTSMNINSCYAIGNESYGYFLGADPSVHGFRSNIVYSTLNANACDNMPNGISYAGNFNGVTFSGNGSEKAKQGMKIFFANGLTVEDFWSTGIGVGKSEYYIEVEEARTITFSGLSFASGASNNKLGIKLFSKHHSDSGISFLDSSISRKDVVIEDTVSQADRKRVKFLHDTVDVSSSTSYDNFKKYIENKEINAHVIIDITGVPDVTIDGLKGTGSVELVSTGTHNIIDYRGIVITNNRIPIFMKNFKISNNYSTKNQPVYVKDNDLLLLQNMTFDKPSGDWVYMVQCYGYGKTIARGIVVTGKSASETSSVVNNEFTELVQK